ncbi:MAG TPA: hypothetical protein VMR62_26550 [Bryobacteraceae bacterium]|jgi:hypothetical protein|nr:hypothetical protein [Bryobacteraceae bacterium]
MSSKDQSSILDSAVKIAGATVTAIGAIVGFAQLLRKPKVTGFVLEESRGAAMIDSEEWGTFNNEIMLNISVSNRRFQQAAIVDWALSIEGGPQGIRASAIPESYVVCRPERYPLQSETLAAEWPIPNARQATAQPFKTATGWVRFTFRDEGPDLGTHPQIIITATDQFGRKHQVKYIPVDAITCQVLDTNNAREREIVRRMPGRKPPMEES